MSEPVKLERRDMVRASDLASAALNPGGEVVPAEQTRQRLNEWSAEQGIGDGLLDAAALIQRRNAALLLEAGITPSSVIPSMYLTGFLNGWYAAKIAAGKESSE